MEQVDDAYVLGDIDTFIQALEDGVFEKEWNRLEKQLLQKLHNTSLTFVQESQLDASES
mgnify:CR=1 FL=1